MVSTVVTSPHPSVLARAARRRRRSILTAARIQLRHSAASRQIQGLHAGGGGGEAHDSPGPLAVIPGSQEQERSSLDFLREEVVPNSDSDSEEPPTATMTVREPASQPTHILGVLDPRKTIDFHFLPEEAQKTSVAEFRKDVKRIRERERRKMKKAQEDDTDAVTPRTLQELSAVVNQWHDANSGSMPLSALLAIGKEFSSRAEALIRVKEICEFTGNIPRILRNSASTILATTCPNYEARTTGTDGSDEELSSDEMHTTTQTRTSFARPGQGHLFFVCRASSSSALLPTWKVTDFQAPLRDISPTKDKSVCAYTAQDLAAVVGRHRALARLNLTAVRAVISPYARRYLSDNFMSRVRSAALSTVFGSPSFNVTLVSALKTCMNLSGATVNYQTITGSEMSQVIVGVGRSEYETSRKLLQKRLHGSQAPISAAQARALRPWRNSNRLESPLNDFIYGHKELLTAISTGGKKYVTELFLAPQSSRAIAGKLLKILSCDAATMKGQGNQFLMFTVLGLTSNSEIVPLVFAFMSITESAVAWTKVFKFLKEVYSSNMDWSIFTVLLDGDKGMEKAREDIVPGLHPFLCARHRFESLCKSSTVAAAKAYKHAVTIPSIDELTRYLDPNGSSQFARLSIQERESILRVPLERQFMAAAIAMGRVLYGRSTSQLAESLNSACLARDFRNLDPPAAVIELSSYCYEKFMAAKGASRLEVLQGQVPGGSADHTKRLTPWASHKLAATSQMSQCSFEPLGGSNQNAELEQAVKVTEPGGKCFLVTFPPEQEGLSSRFGSCTCNLPSRDYWPCPHMMFAANCFGIPLANVVPSCFTATFWRYQYEAAASPPPTRTQIIATGSDKTFAEPIIAPPKRGRKPTARQRGMLERFAKKRARDATQ